MHFQQSPMIDAVDLIRTDAEGLPLEELRALTGRVIKTLFALHELRNTTRRRAAPETRAIIFRISQLELFSARLADLIQLACARATLQAMATKAPNQAKQKSATTIPGNIRS
jgi:hypothetical protein